jgi:hypothetical protein
LKEFWCGFNDGHIPIFPLFTGLLQNPIWATLSAHEYWRNIIETED